MLSYRHAFHAGNFADVFKHVVLTRLVEGLKRKEAPFLALDTHAGAGLYDLSTALARQHPEFREGIGRLWGRSAAAPPGLDPYLEALRAFNPACAGGRAPLLRYPGSPALLRQLLRPGDRLALCELHPADYQALHDLFAADPQVSVHHRDGYEALGALLPPPEHRGVVLIDPSYERRDEWERAANGLLAGWQRWPTGVLALWYPLIRGAPVAQLHRRVAEGGVRKVLIAELGVLPPDSPGGLNGSGMLVVTPPWHLDEELCALLPWLHGRLSASGQGGWRVDWLIPE
jgi:23S rRNA (adenine2030-N6)-methyltransferase